MHAARGIELGEVGEHAVADVIAEFSVGAGERRRLADHDGGCADTVLGARWRGGNHADGKRGDDGEYSRLHGLVSLGWILAGRLDLSQGRCARRRARIRPPNRGWHMASDIEIAQAAKMQRISKVAL